MKERFLYGPLLVLVFYLISVYILFDFKEYKLNTEDYLSESYSISNNNDALSITDITANVVAEENKSNSLGIKDQPSQSAAKNKTKGNFAGGGGEGSAGGSGGGSSGGTSPPEDSSSNSTNTISPPIDEPITNQTNTSNVTSPSLNPLDNGLVLYFKFDNQQEFNESTDIVHDFSGNDNTGDVMGNAIWDSLGGVNGSGAYQLDGIDDYISVPDSDILSPSITGQYSVTFWVKFLKTAFIGEGSTNSYINYMGKGESQNYEFSFRQHNSSNPDNRPDRISTYTFNLNGGLGAGSYFQDTINIGEWIFVSSVYNGTHISIWKNAILRDTDPLSGYNITLQNGKAPFNIGTLNRVTFLKGSIDELRVYNRTLNSSQISQLYMA